MQTCTRAARLPYVGAGRAGRLKNLFSDEASHRDEAVSITASSPIFVTGRFAETLKSNRFYTLVISLNRAAGIGDRIRIQGAGSTSTDVFGPLYASAPESADNAYCFTVYSGVYNDVEQDTKIYNLRECLNGWGAQFRSFNPNNTAGTGGIPSEEVGIAQEATVKWIACYEGIHHVGRAGFVPYDNTTELAAALSTLPAPVITEQPQDATITSTENAVFSVTAGGYGIQYQWQYLKPGGSWKNCSAATEGYNTATVTVAGVSGKTNRNGYQYRCTITDANNKKIYSEAATLTVETS